MENTILGIPGSIRAQTNTQAKVEFKDKISVTMEDIYSVCVNIHVSIYIYINAKWLHIYTKTYFCGGEVSVFEEVISLSFI